MLSIKKTRTKKNLVTLNYILLLYFYYERNYYLSISFIIYVFFSEWGWSLTNKTRILPDPLYRSRRIVDLNLKEIKYPHITHAIVKLTPDDLEKQLTVNFDSYFYNNRMESTRNRFLHPKYLFGFRGPNLIETVKGSIRYYITLPNIIDAITIEFKSLNCIKHHAIVELIESSNIGSTQVEIFTNT